MKRRKILEKWKSTQVITYVNQIVNKHNVFLIKWLTKAIDKLSFVYQTVCIKYTPTMSTTTKMSIEKNMFMFLVQA